MVQKQLAILGCVLALLFALIMTVSAETTASDDTTTVGSDTTENGNNTGMGTTPTTGGSNSLLYSITATLVCTALSTLF